MTPAQRSIYGWPYYACVVLSAMLLNWCEGRCTLPDVEQSADDGRPS